MAQIISPRKHITLALPDIQNGDTRIKQVGYVIEQGFTQPLETGEVAAVIVVQVRRFAVDTTKPGELGVEYAEFNPRAPVRLIGTNDTLLAADTGEVVAQRTTEPLAAWLAIIADKAAELDPRPVVLQGDALELMREQPTVVANEIRRHLAAAPAHHFAPKDVAGQPILPVP